jgi:hypothetical protein
MIEELLLPSDCLSIGEAMTLQRSCPGCSATIVYKSKYSLKEAEAAGSCCRSCRAERMAADRGPDLVGQQFGRLLVLEKQTGLGQRDWKCICECGRETLVSGSALRTGNTRSCGCLAKESTTRIDLIGQRFGKLLVISFAGLGTGNQARWSCQCDCGNIKTVAGTNLRLVKGKKYVTSSCGCDQYRLRVPPWKYLWHTYKLSAQRADRVFELSEERFSQLVTSDCEYCGAAPSQPMSAGRRRKNPIYDTFRWNGIDRVDSRVGYTPENTVACCPTCNQMKSDRTYEEFMQAVNAIAAHQQKLRAIHLVPKAGL